MADVALPRSEVFDFNRAYARATEWVIANREMVALAGIVFVAAVLRFWDLGARALHHDESLHAFFSYQLAHAGDYRHDPLMHGPFQFHMNALIFFLFGANDVTARMGHALFGTALVAMPLLLKRQVGMKAVLITSALIAVSPTLLYFSRFDREDIYTVVWTFATVICLWRYLDEGREAWLYGMGAALALAFCTKELTYISVAAILVSLDVMLAYELAEPREREEADIIQRLLRTTLIAPVAWLIAAAWPLLGRKPFGRKSLPRAGDVLVVLGTLSLPMFAAAVQEVPGVSKKLLGPNSSITHSLLKSLGNKGYNDSHGLVPQEDSLKVTTIVVLIVVSAYVGLMWKPKQWLLAAAAFWIPFILLYTTFFTNTPAPWSSSFWHGHGGFFSGTWSGLDYWLAQQNEKRGNQPIYYYALFTPLYEFLPLVLTAAGAFWILKKGDGFKRWLLFWIGATFIGLTLAGEKMPWLEVHLALPLAVAGGVCLAKALDGLEAGARWQVTAAQAVLAFLGMLFLVVAGGSAGALAGVALIAGAAGWVLFGVTADRRAEWLRGGLAIAVGAMLALTVRAGFVASFDHGDIPVEMLVYTQTSPELKAVRDRIDALAKQSGLGYNLPIVVDSTDGFSWPWAWYLRDYHETTYIVPAPGYKVPANAVLLIDESNIGSIDATGFTETEYVHRWWLPEEDYRHLTPSKVAKMATSVTQIKRVAHYFLYRRVSDRNSSVKAVALFPASLSAFDVKQPSQPVTAPATQGDGRVLFGGQGPAQGQLQQPADVTVDAKGNIWVADSKNGRIQEFDPSGKFLATVGRTSNQGGLTEPWSVAVDKDGTIYVADTWNHRIVKYGADGNFLQTWGQPSVVPTPGPFDLFGPRDITLAPDGTLWVSDTGNKRLLNYSTDGKAIRTLGTEGSAPGQFNEAVGIAFDPAGNLYVADAWNARIQKFDTNLTPVGSFKLEGTPSHGVSDKPYIAVLNDGRIVMTDPGFASIVLFTSDGKMAGRWQPAPTAKPVGISALPDGGFVFTDSATNQVQTVPVSAIAALFK